MRARHTWPRHFTTLLIIVSLFLLSVTFAHGLAAPVARTCVGFVSFDETNQKFDEVALLGRRQRRHDLLVGRPKAHPDLDSNLSASSCERKYPGTAVVAVYGAPHEAKFF